jgi:hypothetical protein
MPTKPRRVTVPGKPSDEREDGLPLRPDESTVDHVAVAG